jgi:hypothetical protein
MFHINQHNEEELANIHFDVRVQFTEVQTETLFYLVTKFYK